ncbi:6-hydroxy-D-nicotine oxidase [Coprinopsis cinerea okayama7|uniref:6-hydroxy-D-nicotine oxidase n=1 Tax=Coprinopsis cinerea (strain Okayama-7 / 130 / ATCC MYA-4618 / FGSC 9003) TaxID=240176 RepID=A8P628_COPC7|nr:6-hydroxy-D-nicotine oxidase [Coprinopsis cinerea okayama7\|eukprot:XP_001839068.1 6-hydroxy-D-nicotine oxidase [Coprinopsis cinerea okayama7\
MTSFETFVQLIKGDIITPSHSEYSASIARWAKNAERKARLVIYVKDAEDIATCIAYAREHKLLFAIRGGGHSPSGCSSAEDGMVVDLSRYLAGVRVDPERRLAYVGGGAIWKTVDEAAIEYGLATVGGTDNTTGVGGLTLGGGYGYLSGRHGLTIDNLEQVTLVLADGSVSVGNEVENPDLFWAIRGGGSNFGVATELVLRLHPQRRTVFAGLATFPGHRLGQLIGTTKRWLKTIHEDEVVFQMWRTDKTGPIVDKAKEIPYEELNAIIPSMVPHGKGRYLRAIGHKEPDLASTAHLFAKILQVTKSSEIHIMPLHEYRSTAKINSVPMDCMAFRRTRTNSILFITTWDQLIEDQAELTNKARQLITEVVDECYIPKKLETRSPGEVDPVGYSNAGESKRAVPYRLNAEEYFPRSEMVHENGNIERARAVFGSNLPRLQELKKRYDPEAFFNRWCPIPLP